MEESTIQPPEIQIDTVINGVARLLCHWNYQEFERDEQTLFKYEEAVIKWSLPAIFNDFPISTRSDVENYITINASEIMSFAKATKLTL